MLMGDYTKGCITDEGHLMLKRGHSLKFQDCPFHHNNKMCGDWCPHFEEPGRIFSTDIIGINLSCGAKRYLRFREKNFEDRR